jgi:hypothetical protein
MSYLFAQRRGKRVPLDVMYSEYVQERQMLGMIVDASEDGLRVQRLLKRTHTGSRVIQLEFALPGVDEMIWAKGEICFDQMWNAKAAPTGLVRTSGVRLVAAARKHMRMLREFVNDWAPPLELPPPPVATRDGEGSWLMRASCFR